MQPLELAAVLAGLDDDKRTAWLRAYDQPQDLAMIEAESLVEVFCNAFLL